MDARGAAAWKPVARERSVSDALRAYAAMTTSADTGAVRDISRETLPADFARNPRIHQCFEIRTSPASTYPATHDTVQQRP